MDQINENDVEGLYAQYVQYQDFLLQKNMHFILKRHFVNFYHEEYLQHYNKMFLRVQKLAVYGVCVKLFLEDPFIVEANKMQITQDSQENFN